MFGVGLGLGGGESCVPSRAAQLTCWVNFEVYIRTGEIRAKDTSRIWG